MGDEMKMECDTLIIPVRALAMWSIASLYHSQMPGKSEKELFGCSIPCGGMLCVYLCLVQMLNIMFVSEQKKTHLIWGLVILKIECRPLTNIVCIVLSLFQHLLLGIYEHQYS